ncbi:amidase family protein [Hoeflea sp. TYP-13]|uniref:amidase family protein n=1 Tax=Hoeflea sp. TYP-13 TaxID=3230023 RepID=UPI0034C6CC5D
MTDNTLLRPLREIATLVQNGNVQSGALFEQAVSRAHDAEKLNIFTALSTPADSLSEGPLAGIPYAVKDAIKTASLPTCGASPALQTLQVSEDAAAITLLNSAGARLIGKTNMHELSFGVTSNNAAFGPVRNPYAPDRIAGGSSGGSAAAVAAGIVAFAMAADTGGSARIPAALCGLIGFRPTTGRWPDDGLIKVSPTRDSLGVIVRHAEDALLVDAVLTGDSEEPAVPELSKLHFALLTEPYMTDIDPDVRQIVTDSLAKLRRTGAAVTEESSSQIHDLEAECGFTIALTEARGEIGKLAGRIGLDVEDFVARVASADVRGILAGLSDMEDRSAYERAKNITRPALQRAYDAVFSAGVDAILMPTTPRAAARIGEDNEVELNGRMVPTFPTFARNTSPASVAGVPSITIPIGCTPDGLPVGLLVEARPHHDRRLLAIARLLSTLSDPIPAPDWR